MEGGIQVNEVINANAKIINVDFPTISYNVPFAGIGTDGNVYSLYYDATNKCIKTRKNLEKNTIIQFYFRF